MFPGGSFGSQKPSTEPTRPTISLAYRIASSLNVSSSSSPSSTGGPSRVSFIPGDTQRNLPPPPRPGPGYPVMPPDPQQWASTRGDSQRQSGPNCGQGGTIPNVPDRQGYTYNILRQQQAGVLSSASRRPAREAYMNIPNQDQRNPQGSVTVRNPSQSPASYLYHSLSDYQCTPVQQIAPRGSQAAVSSGFYGRPTRPPAAMPKATSPAVNPSVQRRMLFQENRPSHQSPPSTPRPRPPQSFQPSFQSYMAHGALLDNLASFLDNRREELSRPRVEQSTMSKRGPSTKSPPQQRPGPVPLHYESRIRVLDLERKDGDSDVDEDWDYGSSSAERLRSLGRRRERRRKREETRRVREARSDQVKEIGSDAVECEVTGSDSSASKTLDPLVSAPAGLAQVSRNDDSVDEETLAAEEIVKRSRRLRLSKQEDMKMEADWDRTQKSEADVKGTRKRLRKAEEEDLFTERRPKKKKSSRKTVDEKESRLRAAVAKCKRSSRLSLEDYEVLVGGGKDGLLTQKHFREGFIDEEGEQAFIIHSILEYNPSTKRFLVSWRGYGPEDASWQTQKDIPDFFAESMRAAKAAAKEGKVKSKSKTKSKGNN